MSEHLTQLDKNLAVETIGERPVHFVNALEKPFALYGLCDPYDGTPLHRIPEEVARATNEGVAWLNHHTSGGRVRFCTDSPYLGVRVRLSEVELMPHMTLAGTAGLDAYLGCEGEYRYHSSCLTEGGNEAPLRMTRNGGYTNLVQLPPEGMKDLLLNLPLYGGVKELWLGIAPGSRLEAAPLYRDLPPTLYYGSSITQGGCASRPGNNYPGILSRRYNVDFRNLGFSGSARGEQVMAEYIASQPMSAFVYAYDHNAPDVAHLAATHGPMYRRIRAAHPHIPVIFITRPGIRYNHEEKARREVVMDTFRRAVDAGERVYFLDGERIFSIFGGDGGSVDGCHPNDLGFACVAAALDPLFAEIYG